MLERKIKTGIVAFVSIAADAVYVLGKSAGAEIVSRAAPRARGLLAGLRLRSR